MNNSTKKSHKRLSVQEETSFILMILLDEGKSNLPYQLMRYLAGARWANRHYLKKLFKGHLSINYTFYRDKFEKKHKHLLD